MLSLGAWPRKHQQFLGTLAWALVGARRLAEVQETAVAMLRRERPEVLGWILSVRQNGERCAVYCRGTINNQAIGGHLRVIDQKCPSHRPIVACIDGRRADSAHSECSGGHTVNIWHGERGRAAGDFVAVSALLGGPCESLQSLLHGALQIVAAAAQAAVEMEHWIVVSTHDGLTGALNRRGIETVLGQHAVVPLCLVVLDVDQFKPINDTFGHSMGDRVLRETAGIIRRSIRPGDKLGRLGGDEFLVVLRGAEPMAKIVARRIQHAIASHAWRGLGLGWPLTVSIGVAQWQQGEVVDAALERADHLMLGHKRLKARQDELHGET